MAACEKCWTEASRRAYLKGGSPADWYHQVLAEDFAAHHDVTLEEDR